MIDDNQVRRIDALELQVRTIRDAILAAADTIREKSGLNIEADLAEQSRREAYDQRLLNLQGDLADLTKKTAELVAAGKFLSGRREP